MYTKFIQLLLMALVLTGCASTGDNSQTPIAAPTAIEASNGGNSSASVSANDYLLNEGDRISIQVFDEPDLTMDAVISASGIINYSYLGDIQVSGKTTESLEQEITVLLQNGYLVNPSVNITVAQYRPFFINGEVRSPGSYPYQPGLTLDKAISLAGGLTDRASKRKMFVLPADKQKETRANMATKIAPGDVISIREGFF